MVSLRTIDNDRQNIIKDLKPSEMKAYIQYNVNRLYEAFLEHNEEIALASKRNIEEATKLYEAKGYENSLAIELGLRLDKANAVLVETLEAKQEKEVELSKVIVGNNLGSYLGTLTSANLVLEKLVKCYEEDSSEVVLATTKAIAEDIALEVIEINWLLEDVERTEKLRTVFSNVIGFIEEEYSTYSNLVKKINSF